MMTQNDPVQQAWNEAAAMPRPVGSVEGVFKDGAADDTCIGALAQLLHPTGDETVCPHLWQEQGLRWWVLLEQPGQIMCGQCVPKKYTRLLGGSVRRVRMRCSCCEQVKWLAGPRIVTRDNIGTALGFLCGPCSTERPAQLVEVSW